MKLLPLLSILALAIVARAEDTVEQIFPLEAARVLASQHALMGEVTAAPEGDGKWKIAWRDAAGKVVRERAVSADASKGSAYFRDIFRQLVGDDWRPQSAPPDNAPSAFWQGADLAGTDRDDALKMITKLLAEKPNVDRAADAARLAGVSVQAASPAPDTTRALDVALLARGAAWLALAEARLREPIEAAWAPILFLAGHKEVATELWKSAAPKKLRTNSEKSWNLALGGPQRDAAVAGTTPATIPPPDFTDADKAWTYLQKLHDPPRGADSPEDQMRRVREWLTVRRDAAERFRTAFPNDARKWDAAIIAYDSGLNLVRYSEREVKPPSTDVLEAILAAPDASAETKGDAAFFRAMDAGKDVSPRLPHTLPPFHRALSEFIEAYPQHPRAPTAAGIQLQLLGAVETPGADKLLASLAAHANPQIAAQAKGMIEHRARFAELKKKPIELKFTAADGAEIDLAKLRGKVVLLDFWASWCGPCMTEAPHVVATYGKLRDRGFEIIGINLDEDKTAMEAAMKRVGMTWPQHFDGKGWQNELAQRFGIRSIPATWLFDKEGKLRELDLRGEELEARIENLLKEK